MAMLMPLDADAEASFSFRGVIAASSQGQAEEMRDHMESMCNLIISTYRTAVDNVYDEVERKKKLLEIVAVQDDVAFLCSFMKSEMAACPVDTIAQDMKQLVINTEELSAALLSDFARLKIDTSLFPKVFDKLLSILEDGTSFFKLGHRVQMERVVEYYRAAVKEVVALRDVETIDDLVLHAKIVSRTCLDLLRGGMRLIIVLPEDGKNENVHLQDRLEAAQMITKATLPMMIQAAKKKVVDPSAENIEEHKHACSELSSVLNEIADIIKLISVKFESDFNTAKKSPDSNDLSNLDGAVTNLVKKLAKLRSAADAPDKGNLEHGITQMTSSVIDKMRDVDMDTTAQAKLVSAVKSSMVGENNDFFQASQDFNALVGQAREIEQTKAKLETGEEDELDTDDLLTAAMSMLSSMKNMTDTLELDTLMI